MNLDERAARARDELTTLFTGADAPPVTGVRRRHRRRIATRAVIGGAAVAALAFGVLAMVDDGAPNGVVTTPTSTPPADDLPRLEISTEGVRFVPDRLETTTGDAYITLRSNSGQHSLVFEDPSVLAGSLDTAGTGTTATARASFAEPGEYVFYCTIPGHREGGMEGVVVVTGNPTTTAAATTPATGDALVHTALPDPVGPRPQILYAVRDDGALVSVDTATGTEVEELARLGDPRIDVEEGPGPNVINVVVVDDDGVAWYEECCEPVVCCTHRAPQFGDDPEWVGTSPTAGGSTLAMAFGNQIELRDRRSGEIVHSIAANAARGLLAMSPDGDRLAVPVEDGRLLILDTDALDDAGALEVRIAGDLPEGVMFERSAFFADGRLLVAFSDGRLVMVDREGNVADADDATRLSGISDLAVSASGHLIVTGADHIIRSWNGSGWDEIASGYYSADW